MNAAQDDPGGIAVRSPTLSQQISDALLRRIVRGDYRPGESMPSEEELAAQFDVSRPVVREAVKELAVIGLIESRQGRSTRVAPESEWNYFDPRVLIARSEVGAVDVVLLELLELRRVVEAGGAGLAALRRQDEDLAVMQSAIDEMERMIARGKPFSAADVTRFTEADIRFHKAVLHATGNQLLIKLIDLLGPLLRVGRRISLERRPDGPADSLQGHVEILNAVRDGRMDRARQAMREHLSWTANLKLDDDETDGDRSVVVSPWSSEAGGSGDGAEK